jgi:hypothetical protein
MRGPHPRNFQLGSRTLGPYHNLKHIIKKQGGYDFSIEVCGAVNKKSIKNKMNCGWKFVYSSIRINIKVMKDKEPEEENRLTEAEQWALEQEMLDIAFENSYLVITKKCTFDDLLKENHKKGRSAIMAHDPNAGATYEELLNMIDYYIELDEPEYYLRCSLLKPMLDAAQK